MRRSLVYHLVLKDWYLQRWTIVAGLGAGLVCLALLCIPTEAATYAATIGLLTVLIVVGVQLVFSTVISERREQTLAFVMSLPITPHDYTLAKLLANLTIFMVPWTALVVGTVGVILARPSLPNGLIPMAIITLTEILASSCLVLATALMTESQNWTVAALITGNLSLNTVIASLSRVPSIHGPMEGPVAVWSQAALIAIGVELAIVAGLIALTFYVRGRKTSFL